MNLLEAWQNWEPGEGPPYVHDMDADALNGRRWERKTVTFTLEQATMARALSGRLDDHRLHLGLYPLPFTGNLESATVYILLANPNPGIGNYHEQAGPEFPDDYFAIMGKGLERYVRENLNLEKTAEDIAKQGKMSACDALSRVAILQLSPYWSKKIIGRAHKLPSADLAVKFVEETVVPRARDGKAIVIVTRCVKEWNRRQGLPQDLIDAGRIVLYKGGEPRGAQLGPTTRGGQAILRHFGIEE